MNGYISALRFVSSTGRPDGRGRHRCPWPGDKALTFAKSWLVEAVDWLLLLGYFVFIFEFLKDSCGGVFLEISLLSVFMSLVSPGSPYTALATLDDFYWPLILGYPLNVCVFKYVFFDSVVTSHVFLGSPPRLGLRLASYCSSNSDMLIRAPWVSTSALPGNCLKC